MAISSLIVGFGHRARSGKDTAVAEIIKQRGVPVFHGVIPVVVDGDFGRGTGTLPDGRYDVRRYAFADILKQEVVQAALSAGGMSQLFRSDYYFMNEREDFVQLPEWVKYEEDAPMDDPMCPLGKQRTLLQWWGTEFRRNVNPDYWVKRLAEKLEKDQPEIALLTDMRFHNEMAFVKQYGETIRVDRDGLPPLTDKSHPSEKELASVPDEDWTRILTNNSTLEEFKQNAVEAFDTIMEFQPRGYGLV